MIIFIVVSHSSHTHTRIHTLHALTAHSIFARFTTVKTPRHRLKQPKFVLHCKQLRVGLTHAISYKAIQRVPLNESRACHRAVGVLDIPRKLAVPKSG